ncbi:MAG TPA: class I SAM-dependent methyltransferase [Candidatus Tectomicrobia bacterium]
MAQLDSGSFRDPAGRIYHRDGRVFRTVTQVGAPDFEFVRSTGLVEQLSSNGSVIPAVLVDRAVLGPEATDAVYVLEHPRLPFISYPYEWCFAALKAAALAHLEIQIKSLECGVTLSDASAYNIQLVGTKPIFIDYLSFRKYRPGEFWIGHRQFCMQFLNPLLLRAIIGIPHNNWYRSSPEGINSEDLNRLLPFSSKLSRNILTHVALLAYLQKVAPKRVAAILDNPLQDTNFPLKRFLRMLKNLSRWIETLKPADTGKSVWRDYSSENSYVPEEAQRKADFVSSFVSTTKPKLLWDLGCNTGDYSAVALQAGVETVIGFDIDHQALDRAFTRARESGLAFLPLYSDSTNPTPSQGWAQAERKGLQERAPADGLLALALVHHLAVTNNIPLGHIVSWLTALAPCGVIEFVPKSDPMFQRLIRLREDIFSDYTEEKFLNLLGRYAAVVRKEHLSENGRCLVWYAKN